MVDDLAYRCNYCYEYLEDCLCDDEGHDWVACLSCGTCASCCGCWKEQ